LRLYIDHLTIKNDDFNNCLDKILYKINNEDKHCIFTGEFNIHLNNEKESASYINMLNSNHTKMCITVPTRVDGNTRSVIDHIGTNILDVDINSGAITTKISDHYPIYMFLNFKIETTDKSDINMRVYDYCKKY